MIKDIKIKGFRGIRQGELNNTTLVNLLFGKNNCGKSSVLEALFTFSNRKSPLLALRINDLRGITDNGRKGIALDFYNGETENNIEFEANIVDSTHIKSIISLRDLKDKTVSLSEPLGIDGNEYELVYSTEKDGNFIGDVSYEFRKAAEEDKYKVYQNTSGDIEGDEICAYVPPAYSLVQSLDAFRILIQEKREHSVVESLRTIEPRIKDIVLSGDDILVDVGKERRFPINVLGDGVRKMLAILLIINQCAGGMVLIDEVDNGFHFSAMENLWKAILATAKQTNTQLFITTHNIDSLRGLNQVLMSDEYSGYRDDVSAYKLIKNLADELITLKYDYHQFSYAIQQEIEIR
jgi:AAA15 family ATPase/GTPase